MRFTKNINQRVRQGFHKGHGELWVDFGIIVYRFTRLNLRPSAVLDLRKSAGNIYTVSSAVLYHPFGVWLG